MNLKLNIMCILLTIYFQPYVKKTYEITVNIRNFITTKIKEHRDTFDPENVRDFIDLYLMAEREEGTNSESAKTGMKSTKFCIFRYWIIWRIFRCQLRFV